MAITTTTTEELRQLSAEELTSKVREMKEELFNLRFQAATGQLESHGRLGAVRKEIARVYTIMRERDKTFEYIPCLTRSDTSTVMVLSILSLTTTPSRTLRNPRSSLAVSIRQLPRFLVRVHA